MKIISVKDMINIFLESKGYDGLCNSDLECGCSKDNLAPCENIHEDCVAARKESINLYDDIFNPILLS